MWYAVDHITEHFQYAIGLGLVLGFRLVYKYIIIIPWLKKYSLSASWLVCKFTRLTSSQFVGEFSNKPQGLLVLLSSMLILFLSM